MYSFLVFGQSGELQNPKLKNSNIIQSGTDAATNLQKFSAIVNGEKTNLQWTLTTGNNVSTVIIEKGNTADEFKACAEFWVNFDGNTETNFQYVDKKINEDARYYQLKILDANGKVQYSNIINVIK
ncbi:MAG: hypothetical protein ACXWWC_06485 [Chitinophagaceae bacterium]